MEWTDFDEWQGVVVIEVQVAARAMSGRSKHTDPDEIAAWIAHAIQTKLREGSQSSGAEDLLIGKARVLEHRDEAWTTWPETSGA